MKLVPTPHENGSGRAPRGPQEGSGRAGPEAPGGPQESSQEAPGGPREGSGRAGPEALPMLKTQHLGPGGGLGPGRPEQVFGDFFWSLLGTKSGGRAGSGRAGRKFSADPTTEPLRGKKAINRVCSVPLASFRLPAGIKK